MPFFVCSGMENPLFPEAPCLFSWGATLTTEYPPPEKILWSLRRDPVSR
ncbi:hypothetical protein BACCAP_00557 [Pseudoflavonifractor capillosus ATCC 29799]|uniref:Uncharacterized protein n=1 Tax=Pseudoflavonifractor capillosus ATCC 29799 TaxID=411467 RepID=A6NQT6_9FIRM|nr:hypothetical protein BACCAP_00557 [Pseudoflavonifractor capillosus ATCC 29799]